MIKVIKYFTSVEYTSGEETILDSPRGPCEGPLGEDDLQTFDFISKLKLDLLEAQYTGITRVRGSNRMQTAYRLEKDADVTLPTKYVRFTIDLFSNKSLKIFTKLAVHTFYVSLFFILFIRIILPNGLPEEFSAVCTFRARKLPKYTWHIIRIVDMENEPQFLIAMNPKTQTLDFSMNNQTRRLQTVSFTADRVSK